jgi:hypothetical protein
MSDYMFFDLPVYRIGEEKYLEDRDSFVSRSLAAYGVTSGESFDHRGQEHQPLLVERRARLEKLFGGCWRFNETIGYIRLHFLGCQVRGEYYSVSRKRIIKTRKKQFEFQTWKLAPEIDFNDDATSDAIFSCIMDYVADCRRELPGRYIDDGSLRALGPFLDWRRMHQHTLTQHLV